MRIIVAAAIVAYGIFYASPSPAATWEGEYFSGPGIFAGGGDISIRANRAGKGKLTLGIFGKPLTVPGTLSRNGGDFAGSYGPFTVRGDHKAPGVIRGWLSFGDQPGAKFHADRGKRGKR